MLRAAVPILLAPLAGAQTIDDIRDEVRALATDTRYPAFLSGFLGLTGEPALTGSSFRVGDKVETHFSLLTYPLHTEVELTDGLPDLRLEADVGYATARFDVPDIFGGASPAVATRVTSRYTTYGGVAGGGPVFPWGDVRITPVVLGGFARVENKALYGGPGAAAAATVFDGILFNWDAT
jgi:hypothetical protein